MQNLFHHIPPALLLDGSAGKIVRELRWTNQEVFPFNIRRIENMDLGPVFIQLIYAYLYILLHIEVSKITPILTRYLFLYFQKNNPAAAVHTHHTHTPSGDEQQARWQFRDIVSPH
jgi:hypothetical protein